MFLLVAWYCSSIEVSLLLKRKAEICRALLFLKYAQVWNYMTWVALRRLHSIIFDFFNLARYMRVLADVIVWSIFLGFSGFFRSRFEIRTIASDFSFLENGFAELVSFHNTEELTYAFGKSGSVKRYRSRSVSSAFIAHAFSLRDYITC